MSNEDGKSMGLALILPLLLYIVYLIREIRVSHRTCLRPVRIAVLTAVFITIDRPRTASSMHFMWTISTERAIGTGRLTVPGCMIKGFPWQMIFRVIWKENLE